MSLPKRCTVCRRTGHTNRAHANLTGPELAALKADGLEFMGRGFRELGEPAPNGDLLDQLRADTEAELLAGTSSGAAVLAVEMTGDPAGDVDRAQLAESVPGTADLLGALQASVDRARDGRPSPVTEATTSKPGAPGDPVADIRAVPEALARFEPRQSGKTAAVEAVAAAFEAAGHTVHRASHEVPKEEDPQFNEDTGTWSDEDDASEGPIEGDQEVYAGGGELAIGHAEQQIARAYRVPGYLLGTTAALGEQGPQFAPWRTVLGPAEPIRITLPGVYELTAAEYHDPAVTGDWLSNSDARQLIGDGCPAQFRYNRDNGIRKTSAAFSMGHAVHARILGKGETIVVRPPEFDSWRTKASQAWRAEQERAGRSVILPEDAEVVEAMASAVHQKPRAHELLSQPGRPEMCLFWVDPETGVRRRCMVDYLPSVVNEHGVMEPVDIKSADSVAPTDSMERKLYDHAWHRQGTTIADGIIALGLAAEVEFYFIVQSKTAPHLVTIVKLDADAERIGRIENRQALLVYKECLETDHWPDYAPDPVTLSVPPWIARAYEEDVH